MRQALAVLILVAAMALNAIAASAEGKTDSRPLFYGDGFDNTTCVDAPRASGC